MSAQEFWNSITLADLMPLFGAAALLIGGAALIASSIPMRAELVARRVDFAMPQKAFVSPKAEEEAHRLTIQHLPSMAGGLSQSEQRLVILLFSKFGVPARLAAPAFIGVRLAAALGLGALMMIGTGHIAAFAASWLLRFLAAIGGMIAGWILPAVFLGVWGRQRTKAVALGLPDALELLVVCVEAGLSLEDGLHRVSEELAESQPALADELAVTWAEINILPSRAQALANLAERVDDPGVRSVVGMLSQSLRLGTPLAQSFRTGAIEMRNDQMTHLEERASKLPALLTIPVMLFIMPTIFLIIGGPAVLRIIDLFLGGPR